MGLKAMLSDFLRPELEELATGIVGHLGQVQIHPFYYGFSDSEVEASYRQIEQNLLEFGEAHQLPFAQELWLYNEYLARRRSYVATIKAPYGILFEETEKVSRSLERLSLENQYCNWIVVPTKRKDWCPEVARSHNDLNAWREIAEAIRLLGFNDLVVFGAMSGNLGQCVSKIAGSLERTGLFRSVEINEEASFS